ncbi:MAG: hypothetical protein PXX83_08365 [Candidatus Nitrosotalea sp.]|nr:hypothetical protein [Candidatus Nitrosotalea sp.]
MESKENPGMEIFISKNDTIRKIIDLLSVLSKPDAIRIFILARDGIKSRLDTPLEIGLTRKQYYSRLSQLVKIGLVTKDKSVYKHTMFGEIIYHNHLLRLGNEIWNSKYMSMLDIVKQSHRFSNEEVKIFSLKIMSDDAFNNT